MMYEYRAIILRVVDGDTVDVTVDLGFSMTTEQRFRLSGINTPERGRAGFTEATEWLRAALARAAAANGGFVNCETNKDRREKYGRYLITFFDADGNSLNDRLVELGLAERYNP